MTMKFTAVLALALLAPAAFGQGNPQSEGRAKLLRQEILRDKGDLAAKRKSEKAEKMKLVAQQGVELAKVKAGNGNRAEKNAERRKIRAKYAQLIKENHAKGVFERKQLREDMASKHGQIQKLRQS